MEWGIIMAVFTVSGVLGLIFAECEEPTYQTFGGVTLNAPDRSMEYVSEKIYRKAA